MNNVKFIQTKPETERCAGKIILVAKYAQCLPLNLLSFHSPVVVPKKLFDLVP